MCVLAPSRAYACVRLCFTSPFGWGSHSESVRRSLVSTEARVLFLYKTLASHRKEEKKTAYKHTLTSNILTCVCMQFFFS